MRDEGESQKIYLLQLLVIILWACIYTAILRRNEYYLGMTCWSGLLCIDAGTNVSTLLILTPMAVVNDKIIRSRSIEKYGKIGATDS
jgi:hypothetical protein